MKVLVRGDYLPDNNSIVTLSGNVISVWDASVPEFFARYSLNYSTTNQRRHNLAINNDVLAVISSNDDLLGICCPDEQTANPINDIVPVDGHTAAFTPDGSALWVGDFDGHMRIITPQIAGAEPQVLRGKHSGPVYDIAMTSDGRFALSVSDSGQIIKWNVATGDILVCLGQAFGGIDWVRQREGGFTVGCTGGATRELTSVTISPSNEQALAVGVDGIRYEIDLLENTATQLPGANPTIIATSVAYAPDGESYLVAYNNGSLIQWDADSHELIGQFNGHVDPVLSVAYLPDGETAVSSSADVEGGTGLPGEIIWWDLQTGEILRRFDEFASPVRDVVVLNGESVVAVDASGNIVVLDLLLDISTLQTFADENRVLADLSCSEIRNFFARADC